MKKYEMMIYDQMGRQIMIMQIMNMIAAIFCNAVFIFFWTFLFGIGLKFTNKCSRADENPWWAWPSIVSGTLIMFWSLILILILPWFINQQINIK
jgi:hypothetical protein